MYRRHPSRQIHPPFLPSPFPHPLPLSTPGHQKPRPLNHPPEPPLIGKPLNTLHKILIAIPIPRHKLPQQRYRPETPPLIHRIQHPPSQSRRELQTREHAPRFQHAEGCIQSFRYVCEIPDPECDGVEIDRVVGDCGEGLGVGF